eukprot:610062_1
MTETQNIATYARIRPYNPAINDDKRLSARCAQDNAILNKNATNKHAYKFNKVYDMTDTNDDIFETAMKPLLDYKILQGIDSIFIVYGQSGSGKSLTLVGETGYVGLLPMSLQYLLKQDNVESIKVASIEAYGIKPTKIGLYDLVHQLKQRQKAPKTFDAYSSRNNSRLNADNAEQIEITESNCLSVITELQEVSHMAPTLKNPHSSRGHTVYFNEVKMKGLEGAYFIAVDLAGSEGQTALGTEDEFVEGLKLAMSKGKLTLSKKQMKGFETMYRTRSLEAGCINNGLTQLQTIFGELRRKKISKSQGLGLRKILSPFITLKTTYAILFTLSASANNNKVTRATLNFAKQTQLVKVDVQNVKAKIDKDAIIKELNAIIEQLQNKMGQKNKQIQDLKRQLSQNKSINTLTNVSSATFVHDPVFDKYEELTKQLVEAEQEEAQWKVSHEAMNTCTVLGPMIMNEDEMKSIFDEFDEDGGGSIDADELEHALTKMGGNRTMDEVNELILEIDVNNDGKVDFEEFKVMVTKSWFVDAFQSKLITSIERMMSIINMIDDVKEEESDSESSSEELVEEIKGILESWISMGELAEINVDSRSRRSTVSQSHASRISKTMEDLWADAKNGVIDELKTEMKDNETRYNEEMSALHERIASLMTQQLERDKQHEREINEMKRNCGQQKGKLKSEIQAFEQENETLKNYNDEMANVVSVLQAENAELTRNVTHTHSYMVEPDEAYCNYFFKYFK